MYPNSLLDSLVIHDYESPEEKHLLELIKPEYRPHDSCEYCEDDGRFMVEGPSSLDEPNLPSYNSWGHACIRHLEMLRYELANKLADKLHDYSPQCETCGSLTSKHYSEACTL